MTFLPQFPSEDRREHDDGAVVVIHPAAKRTAPPVSASAVAPDLSVTALLCRQLACQRELCRSLEAIADALPDNLDTQHTLHVARSIGATIRKAHHFEENTIFPLLSQHFEKRPELFGTLQRLHYEHWEDESFADELCEKLTDYVRRGESSDAEALGYMLRGFFEGLRRHLAFEEEHVVPLIAELDRSNER